MDKDEVFRLLSAIVRIYNKRDKQRLETIRTLRGQLVALTEERDGLLIEAEQDKQLGLRPEHRYCRRCGAPTVVWDGHDLRCEHCGRTPRDC